MMKYEIESKYSVGDKVRWFYSFFSHLTPLQVELNNIRWSALGVIPYLETEILMIRYSNTQKTFLYLLELPDFERVWVLENSLKRLDDE